VNLSPLGKISILYEGNLYSLYKLQMK